MSMKFDGQYGCVHLEILRCARTEPQKVHCVKQGAFKHSEHDVSYHQLGEVVPIEIAVHEFKLGG
jgi:hypothetical protein